MIGSIRDWSSIVEEGVLTAGESRVILSQATELVLRCKKKRQLRKRFAEEEVVKPKIEEKKGAPPIFDIGLIDVDTAWKKDISNFAKMTMVTV